MGLDEVKDLDGERVYATLTLSGKAKPAGDPVNARFFDLFTLRDGLIVRLEEYPEREQALEAAGLRE